MSDQVSRLLGTCPVCERSIKLTEGNGCFRLVHHGYKRPGHGYIEGDCFAVHRAPYEVSCQATKEYRALVQAALDRDLAYQGRLARREIRSFVRAARWRSDSAVLLAVGVTDLYTWENEYASREREIKYNISATECEIARLTRLVDNWTPKDVRTVMEDKQTQQRAARDARAAERQAARDAKAAKAAAHKAKTEALESKRAAIVADFRAQFQALATEPTSPERDERVAALVAKRELRKHAWIYDRQLDCDDALVALGLAVIEHQKYPHDMTFVRYCFPHNRR